MSNNNFLVSWLNNDIKLSKNIRDVSKDFANFYFYGEIFEKLGLITNDYQNKMDDYSKKENFEKTLNISKEKLGFPQNSDPTKFNHQEFLTNLKNTAYIIKRKAQNPQLSNTFTPASSVMFGSSLPSLFPSDPHLIFSLKEKDNLGVLPPKIIRIEKKLEKYREEKYKHLLDIQRLKKEEDQKYMQDLKYTMEVERSLLSKSIDYIKKRADEQLKNWKYNQEIKKKRLEKIEAVDNFLTKKMRDKFLNEKGEDHKDVKEGWEYFESNCQKLGVELRHDPNKKMKTESQKFNPLAAMQKIRERKAIFDFARHEREVRKTKIMVEQRRLQFESDAKKLENDLLVNFNDFSKGAYRRDNEIAEKSRRKEGKLQKRLEKERRLEAMRVKIDEKRNDNDEEGDRKRMEEYRTRKIGYMEENLQKKITKREVHKKVCDEVLRFMLNLTDLCFRRTEGKEDWRIEGKDWGEAMEIFKTGGSLISEKKFKFFDEKSRMKSQLSKMNVHDEEDDINTYLSSSIPWYPLYHTQLNLSLVVPKNNDYLGFFLFELIDIIYPPIPEKTRPPFPNYLPFKIGIIGRPFSGKKTIANLLNKKYGVEVVAPEEVIREAITLVFPPEEAPDPKSKQPPKKKPVDDPKPIPPLIKDLALQVKEITDSSYSSDILLSAVKAKILTCFTTSKNEQELISELQEAKTKATDRLKELQKLQEEQEKKNKKTVVKKTVNPAKNTNAIANPNNVPKEENAKMGEEEKLNDLLGKNKFYFTKGFCVVDWPRDREGGEKMEEEITGFVEEIKRRNEEGEEKKGSTGFLVNPPSLNEDEMALVESGLDLIIYLDTPVQDCVARSTDPSSFQEKIESYDKNMEPLFSFLNLFISPTTKEPLLQKIDATGHTSEVFERVENVLSKILTLKHEEFEAILNGEKKDEKKEANKNQNNFSIVQPKALPLNNAQELWDLWEDTQNIYINETMETLNKIREKRKQLTSRVKEVQRKFLEIIEKADEKNNIFLKFQESYNSFIEEHPDFIKENLAKEQIEKKLDVLYESTWNFIEKRKNEAISERNSIINSGWIESEIENIASDFQKLLQLEVNKLMETLLIIHNYYSNFEGVPSFDMIEHLIIDPFQGKEYQCENELGSEEFPKFMAVYEHALNLIDNSVNHAIKNRRAKSKNYVMNTCARQEIKEEIHEECLKAMKNEQESVKEKAKILMLLAISKMKELRVLAAGLYSKMDDWTINGIKFENQQVYSLINLLRKSIKENQPSNLKGFEKTQISSQYRPFSYLKYDNYYFPFLENKMPNRFKITELRILYEDTRSFCNMSDFMVNKQILFEYFLRRMNNLETKKFLPSIFLSFSPLTIQNMLNYFDPKSINFLNWKSFMFHMILLSSPPLSKAKLGEYEEILNEKENLKLEPILDISFWFEEIEKEFSLASNNLNLTWKRELYIKKMLFEVYAEGRNYEDNPRKFLDLLPKGDGKSCLDMIINFNI